jgi:hypothetical protein
MTGARTCRRRAGRRRADDGRARAGGHPGEAQETVKDERGRMKPSPPRIGRRAAHVTRRPFSATLVQTRASRPVFDRANALLPLLRLTCARPPSPTRRALAVSRDCSSCGAQRPACYTRPRATRASPPPATCASPPPPLNARPRSSGACPRMSRSCAILTAIAQLDELPSAHLVSLHPRSLHVDVPPRSPRVCLPPLPPPSCTILRHDGRALVSVTNLTLADGVAAD